MADLAKKVEYLTSDLYCSAANKKAAIEGFMNDYICNQCPTLEMIEIRWLQGILHIWWQGNTSRADMRWIVESFKDGLISDALKQLK